MKYTAILISLVLFFSCKKQGEEQKKAPIDVRERFVGTWSVVDTGSYYVKWTGNGSSGSCVINQHINRSHTSVVTKGGSPSGVLVSNHLADSTKIIEAYIGGNGRPDSYISIYSYAITLPPSSCPVTQNAVKGDSVNKYFNIGFSGYPSGSISDDGKKIVIRYSCNETQMQGVNHTFIKSQITSVYTKQ